MRKHMNWSSDREFDPNTQKDDKRKNRQLKLRNCQHDLHKLFNINLLLGWKAGLDKNLDRDKIYDRSKSDVVWRRLYPGGGVRGKKKKIYICVHLKNKWRVDMEAAISAMDSTRVSIPLWLLLPSSYRLNSAEYVQFLVRR